MQKQNNTQNDNVNTPEGIVSGLVLDEVRADEWVGGAWPVVNESGDWRAWVGAVAERQNRYGLETMSCATFGTLNAIEILSSYLKNHRPEGGGPGSAEPIHYGRGSEAGVGAPAVDPHSWGVGQAPPIDSINYSINYSERFTSTLAGTTRNGNSPHKVAETIRKYGVVPEERLPWGEIEEWDEWYDMAAARALIGEATDVGLQHAWVGCSGQSNKTGECGVAELREALKVSPVGIAVYAWAQNEYGRYVRPEGTHVNHWVTLLHIDVDGRMYVLDSYVPYLKVLEVGQSVEMGKKYIISKVVSNSKFAKIEKLLREVGQALVALIKGILS